MLYCNKVKPSFDVPRKVEGRVLRAVAGKDSETVLVVFELLARRILHIFYDFIFPSYL